MTNMAKFNNNNITEERKTENLAGGEAFKQTLELEFVTILLISFVQDQFYRSADDTMDRVKELIRELPDKKFVAKAATFARDKFNMRSITHLVAAELAQVVKGEKWTKDFYNSVVVRPDDVTEILAYTLSTYGKPIPNSLKKGLGKALSRFDDYQLAKYRGAGKVVNLMDAANLLHPKATESLKKLITDDLRSTGDNKTWEASLTQAGQTSQNSEELAETKKAVWKDLLENNKLGYMALVRNLRNIIQQAPESVSIACEQLQIVEKIKKSRLLPFRFVTAYEEMQKLNQEGVREVMVALSKALDISCSNVPTLEGKTLVAIDHSGSMNGRPIKIASLLGTILAKANNADVMIFGTEAKYLPINPLDSTLTISQWIETRNNDLDTSENNYSVGHGTNFSEIFYRADKKYDRMVILSDMQSWVGYDTPRNSYREYKSKYNCNPHIYSVDLAGYGTLQFPQENVYALAGFSEKIFDLMKLLEQDKKAIVNEIHNSIEL